MANYNLYAIKDGNLLNINDITYELKDLKEIDKLTREYRNAQELLEQLSDEGRMLFKPPFGGVKILYASKGQILEIEPLFKESVSNNEKKDVYTQTLDFARAIGQMYDLCVKRIGRGFTVNYKRVREFLENIEILKDPEFNGFLSIVFSTIGVFGFTKNGKMPFEKYLNYIDDFYNTYNPNTGSVDSPNKEKIIDNYYYAVLLGFYRKFYNDGNFNYRGFRDYYCTYYNTFYLSNERNKNDVDDNDGVKRTIEEVYEDDYFPDERKNDTSIMRDENGKYYFSDDDVKTR